MTEISIPKEALEAAKTAWYDNQHEGTSDRMTAVCLAMLKAWPGMHEVDHRVTAKDEIVSFSVVLPIILPLPQEPTND